MKNLLLLIFFFNFLLPDSKETYSIAKDSNKLNLSKNNKKKFKKKIKKYLKINECKNQNIKKGSHLLK